jgi:hypothetical protein
MFVACGGTEEQVLEGFTEGEAAARPTSSDDYLSLLGRDERPRSATYKF